MGNWPAKSAVDERRDYRKALTQMPHVFITGANRGLGLEHARQYVDQGWQVTVTARDPEAATDLQALCERHGDALRIVQLDVTDHAAIEALAEQLDGTPIDILLNNAGSFGPAGAPEGMAYQSLANMDYGIWRELLEINLLAPFKIAVALRPNLIAGDQRLLVMMSTGLASITENLHGGAYAYRSSKAGLNILARGMAAEWPDLIVIAMSPGWCRTDLGGPDAPIDPVDSVRAQQALYSRLGSADTGRFIDMDGETVPW